MGNKLLFYLMSIHSELHLMFDEKLSIDKQGCVFEYTLRMCLG